MRILLVLAFVICTIFCKAQNLKLPAKKITPSLELFLKRSIKPDSIDILLSVQNFTVLGQWKKDVRFISSYSPANTIVCRINTSRLMQLINDTSVVFADLLRKPKEELATAEFDLSLNQFNVVHRLFPFNGSNIHASLKEQRFDTTDIDIKGRYFNSGIAAPSLTGHASRMVTMLGGGGNSSPFNKGAAPGVFVTSSDFVNLLPDADSIYQQYHISIQNHSYGTGIENYYGADAAAFDASIYHNNALMHVFSSGNSGTSTPTDGTYSGILQFANMTGSFKMAKNIITVGAVDSFNTVMELSSKGPAYDGRVKPDLVAFGQDGSSGSAALVSGAATLVQDAYLQTHGTLPSAALSKAVLLNSADHDPVKVINYTTGYGNLNAYEALATITANHFFEDEVKKGQTKSFSLDIPANIAQFKITLVWTDTPAIANAPKALVNDLDATLSFSNTREIWLPWVLNSSANLDSLQLPPTRRIDTLNNVELITVDHPQPGHYIFEVKGSNIVTADQKFAVAYQLDTINHFTWTYPLSTDVLEAGKTHLLRWQSNIQDSGYLECSYNNGAWQRVASNISVQNHYTKWTVPDTSITAQLRFTIPSLNMISESEVFTISKLTDMQVGFNCTDSFMLHWNNVQNNGYQLYQLGDQYMEPVSTIQDTFIVLQKSLSPTIYYAVAPKINNRTGLKSYTIDYRTQGVDCYFQSFYVLLERENTADLAVGIGSTYGVQLLSFQKYQKDGFSNIYTVAGLSGPTSTYFTFVDTVLTKGVNSYRVALTLTNGHTIYSSTESVFYFPDNPVIAFPNPVRQNQSLRLIAQQPGVYSVEIYDVIGKLMYKGQLKDINQELPAVSLSKGVYLFRFYSKSGEAFTKKILVY
ncbi:S8 family peptidase [Chitinophagaceae bacterium LB-8]|uniref:S8 family peptidase n=1 Tax=Paraflavisolibacter caeni TaxID=2982496 RepID=A0A9X2XSQ1_9BACT|nr:S8 family peptidase [Paraflavisolibacter caeni]MCU7547546.1 S8 family peptidase [Paraflavisolibacter caeni]